MFSPARWTIASTPSSPPRSTVPASESQPTSCGPDGSRRTSATGSWPASRSAGSRAEPIRPDAPVTAMRMGHILYTTWTRALPGSERRTAARRLPSCEAHGRARMTVVRVEDAIARVWPGQGAVSEVLGGGITNHNHKVTLADGEAFVLRIAGRDTDVLGIDRSVEHEASLAAAAVGVGPEVVGVRRARGLPRHAVHRRRRSSRSSGCASPRRSGASRHALRAVHPGRRCRRASTASGSSRTTAPSRSRAAPRCRRATRWARQIGAADRAGPRRRPGAPVPQRPAQRELHRRRRPDPDRRLGVRGDGRRLLRSRELLDQPRARRGRTARAARGVLRRRVSDAATSGPSS